MANDDLKKEMLDQLATIQSITQMMFQNEAQRMAVKHGVANPRTIKISQKAKGASRVLESIAVAKQVRANPVEVRDNEAVVYGRIIAEDRLGMSGMTVTLETPEGTRVAGATVETDATGQYTVRVPASVNEQYKDVPLTVTVLDKQNRVVKRQEQAILLQPNERQQANQKVSILSRSAVRTDAGRGTPVERVSRPAQATLFTVRGVIQDKAGKPVSKALVRVYDQDVEYDELLGAEITNNKGEFSITYRYLDFSGRENRADLHFIVVNMNGKELHSTINTVKFDTEHQGEIEIIIPG